MARLQEWRRSEPDLLALDVATGFVLTDSGRILHDNAPDASAAPRVYFGGCRSGNMVRVRHDVGSQTARSIAQLAADEPPFSDPDRAPRHLDEYVALLDTEAPVRQCRPGLSWYFPDALDYEADVRLVGSGTLEGDGLLARLAADGLPQPLVELGFVDVGEFWAPWCVALSAGEIASIAFAARLGPEAAATGVATVPGLRGRGFASAAVAGWAALPALRQRTLFYGADQSNTSSRHVAQRLNLRFLGPTLSIT